MIFTEKPHHIIAGLISPVTISRHGVLHILPQLFRKTAGKPHIHIYQDDKAEIRTIPFFIHPTQMIGQNLFQVIRSLPFIHTDNRTVITHFIRIPDDLPDPLLALFIAVFLIFHEPYIERIGADYLAHHKSGYHNFQPEKIKIGRHLIGVEQSHPLLSRLYDILPLSEAPIRGEKHLYRNRGKCFQIQVNRFAHIRFFVKIHVGKSLLRPPDCFGIGFLLYRNPDSYILCAQVPDLVMVIRVPLRQILQADHQFIRTLPQSCGNSRMLFAVSLKRDKIRYQFLIQPDRHGAAGGNLKLRILFLRHL